MSRTFMWHNIGRTWRETVIGSPHAGAKAERPGDGYSGELEHYGTARDLLLSVRPGITGAWGR